VLELEEEVVFLNEEIVSWFELDLTGSHEDCKGLDFSLEYDSGGTFTSSSLFLRTEDDLTTSMVINPNSSRSLVRLNLVAETQGEVTQL